MTTRGGSSPTGVGLMEGAYLDRTRQAAGEKRDPAEPSFEERVRGDRGAVSQRLHTVRGRDPQTLTHRPPLIVRRGWNLQCATVGADEIGEGPTAVGSDPHDRRR